MSTFFNYERAWDEYVSKEFETLSKAVLTAYKETLKEVDNIEQIGASGSVSGHTQELMELYDNIPASELAWAHEVVYYYGHLAYNKQGQTGGLYWKFQKLANMSLLNRKPRDPELLVKAKAKMKNALDKFNDHKEGTSYSNEELPGFLYKINPDMGKGLLKIYKVSDVNHKPDVFCIGTAHLNKSTGIYLDPNVAPCASCRQPYSNHTFDRVIVMQPIIGQDQNPETFLQDNRDAISDILNNIKQLCEAAGEKIDGFVFVKP